MDWKSYILSTINSLEKETSFDFNSAATDHSIAELKSEFNLSNLPGELKEFYKQANGINELMDNIKIGEVIWPIERVIETNKSFRNEPAFKDLYMSFEELFFFSDAGNGDLFAFVALNDKFDRSDIYVWNHENDSRTWVAPNLGKFIEWWMNGTIKV